MSACSRLPRLSPPLPQVRLSERNIVELVNKLKQLGLLGDDLLYTTNGKEYVTRERAEAEVRGAVRGAGGRIPLVSAATGWLPACLPAWLTGCLPAWLPYPGVFRLLVVGRTLQAPSGLQRLA